MADAELIDVTVAAVYNSSPPRKIDVEEKMICCVREADGKTWRRGKVHRVWAAAGNAEVALLDHGRFLVRPLEDVFPLLARCVSATVFLFSLFFFCVCVRLCMSPCLWPLHILDERRDERNGGGQRNSEKREIYNTRSLADSSTYLASHCRVGCAASGRRRTYLATRLPTGNLLIGASKKSSSTSSKLRAQLRLS